MLLPQKRGKKMKLVSSILALLTIFAFVGCKNDKKPRTMRNDELRALLQRKFELSKDENKLSFQIVNFDEKTKSLDIKIQGTFTAQLDDQGKIVRSHDHHKLVGTILIQTQNDKIINEDSLKSVPIVITKEGESEINSTLSPENFKEFIKNFKLSTILEYPDGSLWLEANEKQVSDEHSLGNFIYETKTMLFSAEDSRKIKQHQ